MMTRSLVFCTAVLLCCLITPQAHGQATAPDSTAVFHQDLAWSPDGRWIVFSANPGAGYDLWLARADGSAMKSLTADGKGNLWAAWSPDGKSIAYTSTRDGGTDIYVMSPDGENPRRLTQGTGRNQAPSWSPDGSRLAFMSDRIGIWQIFIMRSDGSDARRVSSEAYVGGHGMVGLPVTWLPNLDHNPVWSPRESKIVFYTDKGKGKGQIYVIDPDGKHPTALIQNEFNNIYPSWSSDGKRILFTSNQNGPNALFTMKSDGSDVKRVSDRLAFFGRWSPDGKKIAAIFGRYPHTAIGIMSLDGTEPVWITPPLSEP